MPKPDDAAAAVVALETRMARVHATRAESLDVLKANNPWPRAEFPAKAPGLDWAGVSVGARLDREPIIVVWHPAATRGLSALVRSEPLSSWKHWLTFHAIDRNAAMLPRAFVDARFAFHGKVLNGTPQLAERWKRGIAATNAALPEAVGQLYVGRFFPPETKAQMQAMVKNLIAAFGARIDRLEWMSPATKVKAKQKLATLRVGVGYPDTWTDYRPLQIVKGDAFGNRQRAELFDYQRHLGKLGAPVDKGEWWMSPQTVNAVNLPLQNALNFPAAILAPPYFDAAAPAATNYGAIGAVIGHEITHSFDDQGAMFDADGRLANWWTTDDLQHFQAAGAQLAAQYDAYMPFPDLHLNGRQTLSENIADVAGLATAYDGWRASLGERGRAGRGRLQRPAAVLPRLRAKLAGEVARAGAAPGGDHRRPRAGRISRRRGAQSRCVVRRIRGEAGAEAVLTARSARARLVTRFIDRCGRRSGGSVGRKSAIAGSVSRYCDCTIDWCMSVLARIPTLELSTTGTKPASLSPVSCRAMHAATMWSCWRCRAVACPSRMKWPSALHVPLDVFTVRKLGVPGHPELAMGAIASGGVQVLNEEVLAWYRPSADTLEAVARVEMRELERRERLYREGRPLVLVEGRTVILVDDGLATGSTMRAAVQAVRQLHAGAGGGGRTRRRARYLPRDAAGGRRRGVRADAGPLHGRRRLVRGFQRDDRRRGAPAVAERRPARQPR